MIGGAIGAIAGFLSPIPGGAIAGATLGSTLGGMAGGASGDDASHEYGEVTVNVGDRIAQGIIQKVEPVTWNEVDTFEGDGHGGYNHQDNAKVFGK